jgi:dienelactone hydrolase
VIATAGAVISCGRVSDPVYEFALIGDHPYGVENVFEESLAFRRPVVLAVGDTHIFRVDKPLYQEEGSLVENFTRVETFGDPNVHWVRVTVDPREPEVFSFHQKLVPQDVETVSFTTEDGGIVYADVYGTGEHGVVLAHGGRFNKESWTTQARALAAAGFRAVAIDFRGRGQSRGGPQSSSGDGGVHFDVLAAVRYLRDTGAQTVSVVGASFGGGAAAQAAVEAPPGDIDRLVLLAHSAIEEPQLMKGRKLFITARGDTSGSGALRLPSIRNQYEEAPGPKQLVLLDGAAHAQFIFDTEQGERLMGEILRFLSEP